MQGDSQPLLFCGQVCFGLSEGGDVSQDGTATPLFLVLSGNAFNMQVGFGFILVMQR